MRKWNKIVALVFLRQWKSRCGNEKKIHSYCLRAKTPIQKWAQTILDCFKKECKFANEMIEWNYKVTLIPVLLSVQLSSTTSSAVPRRTSMPAPNCRRPSCLERYGIQVYEKAECEELKWCSADQRQCNADHWPYTSKQKICRLQTSSKKERK